MQASFEQAQKQYGQWKVRSGSDQHIRQFLLTLKSYTYGCQQPHQDVFRIPLCILPQLLHMDSSTRDEWCFTQWPVDLHACVPHHSSGRVISTFWDAVKCFGPGEFYAYFAHDTASDQITIVNCLSRMPTKLGTVSHSGMTRTLPLTWTRQSWGPGQWRNYTKYSTGFHLLFFQCKLQIHWSTFVDSP